MVPMAPAAPPTFSMTTGWPRTFCSSAPVRRAMMSVLPPAENGTTTRIGRDGYDSAMATSVAQETIPATTAFHDFMLLSSVGWESGFRRHVVDAIEDHVTAIAQPPPGFEDHF